MIDIDIFKRINDTHGHAAGDDVLQKVAETLVEVSRRIDLVARWGGEEFLLVFPETDLDGARAHAEALRMAVRETQMTFEGVTFNVTISAGVCEVHDEGLHTVERAVGRVDNALYRAKTAGRDRVVADWEV